MNDRPINDGSPPGDTHQRDPEGAPPLDVPDPLTLRFLIPRRRIVLTPVIGGLVVEVKRAVNNDATQGWYVQHEYFIPAAILNTLSWHLRRVLVGLRPRGPLRAKERPV